MIILNVDDDAEDREVFIEAVHEVDPAIECFEAENGQKAFDLLKDGLLVARLEFVFVDINMPVMDGIKLLRLMKADDQLKNIEVYIYTTSQYSDEIKKVEALGARYIRKTNDYKSLVALLRSILVPKLVRQQQR